MNVLWVQLLGLGMLMAVARYVENQAAMRGSNRKPLPDWIERAIRVLFITILAGPSLYAFDTTVIGYPCLSLLLLLYLPSYLDLSEKRASRKPAARKWSVWKLLIDRFNLKYVADAELPEGQAYILGVHPHGVLPIGCMMGLTSELTDRPDVGLKTRFPHIDFRILAASFCFYVPIYRDVLLRGGVVDAARYVARKVLDDGKSLMLVPGGATEALYGREDRDVVYLRKRRGFVKLALETGASLVPVFSFNENNTYTVLGIDSPTLDKIKHKFQAVTGISLPVLGNILPKKANITVVSGAPLAVPKVSNPSDEVVQTYLDKYIVRLTELYEKYRETYNEPSSKPPLTVM